MILLM
ncbi:UNVERIFIED_CONTAM: hypothetical protein GTU68_062940 [Idotea baltica]